MIKIRNKRIALLLVLAMLATMFVGVGAASAASDYTDVASGWTFVQSDTTDQQAGTITITTNTSFDELIDDAIIATDTTVSIVVTLPDGVSFNGNPDVSVTPISNTNDGTAATIKVAAEDLDELEIVSWIDVDDTVTGSIIATVRIYVYDAPEYIFDETDSSVLIAKVDSGVVSVSAAKKKTVQVGEDKMGSAITVKETGPSAFDEDAQEIKYAIITPGVEFMWDAADDEFFALTGAEVIATFDADRDTDKRIIADFDSDDQVTEKVVFTPTFKILPSATKGADVQIKVTGSNIDATTVTVAKIGSSDVAVTVTNPDSDFIYRGQEATFDSVSVKLNPGTWLDEDDYFTVTLPEGVQFQDTRWWDQPIEANDVEFQGLYDNNRTAWFTIEESEELQMAISIDAITANIKLTDWQLIADYDAVVGDLNVTFGGDVSGTYKIGSIKNAFTVATTPFFAMVDQTSIEGANIVITETADGALFDTTSDRDWYGSKDRDDDFRDRGEEFFLNIKLPAGLTFSELPKVKVTDGDLELGDVEVDEDNNLRISIDSESSVASVITISGLEYAVFNQPALGNIVAKVGAEYNMASNNPLESLTIGSVGTPTAVFVIGASTFTLNGVSMPVVSPSYVKNNRTYLAIRDIGTALGIEPYNILWDNPTQTVTLVKGDKLVQMTIGSTIMKINGINISMDVAPEYGPNDRSFLPAAFLAQAFGATAYWDGPNQTVTIKASTY